ncbi:MAG: VWA domain-containing protein [Desulfobacterales bacterium]
MDDILKDIWTKVRKRHFFPELPPPKYDPGESRVGLDIKGKQITISREFVEKMALKLDQEDVLEGLLDHAVSHYLYCPWDLATHLKLYAEAKNVLKDKQMAQIATDYFIDIVADTHCVSQFDSALINLYRQLDKGRLDEVVHAALQRIWGVDLGVEGHTDISRKLSRLPYLDRKHWTESIRRFAGSIQSFLENENKQSMGANSSNPMGCHTLGQYSSQEIEEGLTQLANEAATPNDFKEIVRDFETEISEATRLGEEAMGVGPGHSLDADILYYMKLAENYLLPIRKKHMEASGSLYPHHHIPWEIGHPYQDVDPWTSFGKLMPAITQSWKRHEGEVFGREEGVPDCVLIIDSSGSMTNPRQELSYAVLGAACACDAYLRNDARVAIYNFSDADAGGRKILPYSDNRRDIYRTICHYFGGGTRLGVENIETLQNDNIPDIFLITDMQIINLQLLIQYFNDCENRVTAVHIGDNKHVSEFRRSMDLNPNVGIYAVEEKSDIPRIVLGKIRDFFY